MNAPLSEARIEAFYLALLDALGAADIVDADELAMNAAQHLAEVLDESPLEYIDRSMHRFLHGEIVGGMEGLQRSEARAAAAAVHLAGMKVLA